MVWNSEDDPNLCGALGQHPWCGGFLLQLVTVGISAAEPFVDSSIGQPVAFLLSPIIPTESPFWGLLLLKYLLTYYKMNGISLSGLVIGCDFFFNFIFYIL